MSVAVAVNLHLGTTDVAGGQLCSTQWTIMRRYCKRCHRQHSASIPGVLDGQRYGNGPVSQILVLRYIGVSFEKIEKILGMIYRMPIARSALIHICNTATSYMMPLYDGILGRINAAYAVYGDETGWFLNGLRYRVWVVASSDSVLYHISPSRSKLVATALLADFVGTIISDSYGGWNDIGTKRQKCLLHYFRDMYRTHNHNTGSEFTSFFTELHDILKGAITAWNTGRDGDREVPADTVRELQLRIDALARGAYEDLDCIRYAKRLQREGNNLLTCLEQYVEYHNNTSERLPRMFATMRKVNYGSRSEGGMQATEMLMTVCATCDMRGVNPYEFIKDYLDGKTDDIPMPTVAAEAATPPNAVASCA